MLEYEQKKLTELVNLWYNVHGHTLKDAKYRYSRTIAICERLNDPCFCDFSARDFAEYRTERLNKVNTSTVNHELRYLRAVFNELMRLDYLLINPLSKVRSLSYVETELSFLDDYQIDILFRSLSKSKNKDVYLVAKICLSTGCRWSEAENLTKSSLVFNPTSLKFSNTKNGKFRVVPISNYLMAQIRYIKKYNKLFSSCRSAFRSAVKRSGIVLHEQQMTHVLRHTFASHFLMNGGSIFTLQKILGHSDIKTTMRYAHFSSNYLQDAVIYNPANYIAG